jgi:hypothetical protein
VAKLLGYARVSTLEQNDALAAAGWLRCAGCGQVAGDPVARADVAMTWLLPGSPGTDSVREQHFCRDCVPPGPVADVACVRCGDGPLLGGDLAAGADTATAIVHAWMAGVGWRLSGPVCPNCVGELAR